MVIQAHETVITKATTVTTNTTKDRFSFHKKKHNN